MIGSTVQQTIAPDIYVTVITCRLRNAMYLGGRGLIRAASQSPDTPVVPDQKSPNAEAATKRPG
jgi:hypothetical protein